MNEYIENLKSICVKIPCISHEAIYILHDEEEIIMITTPDKLYVGKHICYQFLQDNNCDFKLLTYKR